MKKILEELINQKRDQINRFGDELFKTPELGFKEFETKKTIVSFLKKHAIAIAKEYCETGFQIEIGQGHPHIGLICELDGIPTPGHPYSDAQTNAAHSCGHSAQVAAMTGAFIALKESGITDRFNGKITLFFTPAEEFTDIAYRQSLIEKGKIRYLSGKENMLADGVFDDVDVVIHLHASGAYQKYRYSVQGTLAGFIYKTFHFQGKAAHAAVLPHEGVNALNACSLFLNAVGLLRETFKDDDMVRFHGIVTHGGDTVNSIPDHVVYEAYVRSSNPKTLLEINERLTVCAQHCAQALNATCIVQDTPGYLPLIQDPLLSDVAYRNMLLFTEKDQIQFGDKSVAAGDIGDISAFKPTIQYGYTGFSGIMHGKDLLIEDKEEVYITQAKIIAYTVYDLLSDSNTLDNILKHFKPTLSRDAYLNYLANRSSDL